MLRIKRERIHAAPAQANVAHELDRMLDIRAAVGVLNHAAGAPAESRSRAHGENNKVAAASIFAGIRLEPLCRNIVRLKVPPAQLFDELLVPSASPFLVLSSS